MWCINVAALRLYAIIIIITRCGRRKGNAQGRPDVNHSCLRRTNTTVESPSCSATLCLTGVHNIPSVPSIHVFICVGVSAHVSGPAWGRRPPTAITVLNPYTVRGLCQRTTLPQQKPPHTCLAPGQQQATPTPTQAGVTHERTHSRRRAQEQRQLTYQHATQHTTAPHTLFLPLDVTTLIRNTADKKSVSLEQEQRQQ